jgi:hypothetical protein
MDAHRQIWERWMPAIQRWGMVPWLARVLEASGPLHLLSAQMIYLTQPVVGRFLPQADLLAAAHLLEDPLELHQFTAHLREVARL